MHQPTFIVFSLLLCTCVLLSSPLHITTRRAFIAPSVAVASSAFFHPLKVNAAPRLKGAAELDAEYYLKNILSKGSTPSSATGFASQRPASNDSCRSAAELELRGGLWSSCLRAFVSGNERRKPDFLARVRDFVAKKNSGLVLKTYQAACGSGWGVMEGKTALEMIDYLEALLTDGSLSKTLTIDQRYFDFVCYLMWRTSSEDVTGSRERISLLCNVGSSVLESDFQEVLKCSAANISTLTTLTPKLRIVLDAFKSSGLLESYRVVSGEAVEAVDEFLPFDRYDDDDLQQGNEVNFVLR